MRWIPRIALTAAVVVGLPGIFGSAAMAQDLPPGVGAAAVTTRYVGSGPFEAITDAAAAATRTCTISDDGLAALALSPVFKESSAATTAATSPSPMTLSRYDEWSGTYGTNSSQNSNYGLYAFRNPYTSHVRAYWNPGIGIWQYDSAGLGAPFTTAEAMDVNVVAADVVRAMAARYCNPPSSLVGHSAPFTDQERRYAAWGDWGYPCTLCQSYFADMTSSTPYFANVVLVAGIDALGGTVRRTCSLQGAAATMPCWYVQPVVGVIQGATAWATLTPDGGGNPTVVPAPLSAPFYVIDRGFTEERHWLRADTGYSIDITASRTIGKNARPRSNQTGSGLTWTASSGLCDLTTGRGVCGPIPPAGVLSSAPTVSATARPIALDADGDAKGDLLLYAAGTGADRLLRGTGGGAFVSSTVSINLSYDHVLPGDVDGDGDDDVLFYASGSGQTFLWRADGDGTFTTVGGLAPRSGLIPFFLDSDGDAAEELFWYGPGSLPDSEWSWSGTTFSVSSRSVSGTFQPVIGDFDGNGRDDVLWYAAGSDADYLWLHTVAGGHVSSSRTIRGTYRWAVGDFDGDDRDDVLWHGPGSGHDSIWYGAAGAAITSTSFTVLGSYTPVVLDLFGTGRSVVIWYAPGTTGDYLWTFSSQRVATSSSLTLPSTQQAVVGRYSAGGADGIFWYGPAGVVDSVWYR